MPNRKYHPPILEGHKVLYKGKRYWVFEASDEFPFQSYEDCCEFVIFDKSNEIYTKKSYVDGSDDFNQGVVAVGKKNPGGGFEGETWYGMHAFLIYGDTIKELVNDYIATEKRMRSWG